MGLANDPNADVTSKITSVFRGTESILVRQCPKFGPNLIKNISETDFILLILDLRFSPW